MSPRLRLAAVLLATGFVGAGCAAVLWVPDPLVSLAERRQPDVLYRGETESGLVALTIDDGPHPETTPRILDALARHGAWATFFLIGEKARDHPELVEQIRDQGHEIGNHLMRDEQSRALGRDRFRQDLALADSILGVAEPKWFRPGSGWYADWMLEEAAAQGYRCVLASAYVQDTKVRFAGMIAWLLRRQVEAGDIVVLHEGSPSRDWTPEVLDDVIPHWQARGWQVQTVGDLVAFGAPPRR